MAKICFKIVKENLRLLRELYVEYPSNGMVLELYGSFLLEMYNDPEKGADLMGRAASMQKYSERFQGNNAQKFSYFDENNGIIFISGKQKSLGEITYINEQACQLLGI